MDVLQAINTVIVAVGVPSIVVALIYIGRQLQVLRQLERTVEKIKDNLKVVCDYLIEAERSTFDSKKLKNYSPGHYREET